MRQGNDVGTQYRSGIYTNSPEQMRTAEAVRSAYAGALKERGFPDVTTEIKPLDVFYFAEEYHSSTSPKIPAGIAVSAALASAAHRRRRSRLSDASQPVALSATGLSTPVAEATVTTLLVRDVGLAEQHRASPRVTRPTASRIPGRPD